jgi:hypothetical protein
MVESFGLAASRAAALRAASAASTCRRATISGDGRNPDSVRRASDYADIEHACGVRPGGMPGLAAWIACGGGNSYPPSNLITAFRITVEPPSADFTKWAGHKPAPPQGGRNKANRCWP